MPALGQLFGDTVIIDQDVLLFENYKRRKRYIGVIE